MEVQPQEEETFKSIEPEQEQIQQEVLQEEPAKETVPQQDIAADIEEPQIPVAEIQHEEVKAQEAAEEIKPVQTDRAICATCGFSNPPHAKFCAKCGTMIG